MPDSESFYFPRELILEILLKLPPKSLLRFTLVSKSWHSLITSPSFISTHLTKTPQTNTLLVRHYNSTHNNEHYSLFHDAKNTPFCLNFTCELSFEFNCCQLGYYRIVGSCNGVLCICDDLFGDLRNLVLWNPCINKFVMLPLPGIKVQEPHMFVIGFGINNKDDYKLVRVVYVKNEDGMCNLPPEVEVYSISTGVWRRVMRGVAVKHCMVEFMWSQVFFEGVVHWIAYDVIVIGGGVRCLVMTFSVDDEVFREIELPDELVGVIPMYLGVMVLEGSLAVVKYERGLNGSGSCEVWVMKSYGVVESWSRLYRINLVAGMEKVVGFRNNGEVLFSTKRNRLVSFDPNSGGTKDLGIRGSSRSFYVQNYVESLVLLRGNIAVMDDVSDGMENLWI